MKTTAVLLLGAASLVASHGLLTQPSPRTPGPAMQSACGSTVYSTESSDASGNIQGELQNTGTGFNAANCNAWLCKGFQFADNSANIQKFTAGQVVPMQFDIRAPHTGVANVSIINTATNTAIGEPLISWDVFASNSVPIQANQTSFSVTIPSDLGSTCSTAGACVIQHYWNAASIDQTYESCIDFTVGGSGGSAPAPSSSAAASAPASSGTANASIPVVSSGASSVAAPTSVVKATTLHTSYTSAAAAPTATGDDGDDDC